MLEFMVDYTNIVSADYLVDKMFGIADGAVNAAVGAGSAALYGFFKII